MKYYGIEMVGFMKGIIEDISSSPKSLDADDSGKIFTNTGASGAIDFNLPSAVKGLSFSFGKTVAQNMIINANTGDYIADSSAAGSITNEEDSETWAFLTVMCLSNSMWTVFGNGTWRTS